MHPVLCSHVKDPIKHEFIKLLHFQDLISSPLLTLDDPLLTSVDLKSENMPGNGHGKG